MMSITERSAYLAQYAEAAYADNAKMFGMDPVLTVSKPESGFYAAAYRDSTTGKIVVAFRGTDGATDVFGADVALATGSWHPQFDEAINFIKALADDPNIGYQGNLEALKNDLLVTGHSLGGALAQLTARLYGLDGATFDPAGAYRQTQLPEFVQAAQRVGVNPAANQVSADFRNYPVQDSLVSGATGPHIGSARVLPQFDNPGLVDALKSLAVGVAASNPAMAILSLVVVDQFGYKHALDNVANSVERLASLETDPTFNPGGGEVMVRIVGDGSYVVETANGQTIGTVEYADGKLRLTAANGTIAVFGENGFEQYVAPQPSGFETLINGINTYGPTVIDALSLIQSIQSGKPLPIVASGLRVANDLSDFVSDAPHYELSGSANVASGVLSLMSLDAALKQGDTLGALTAGAQAVQFGATAYASFANQTLGEALKGDTFGAAGDAIAGVTKALPYLNLINSISKGDGVGAGVALLGIIHPGSFTPVGIAYTVFNLVKGLFGGHDIPDPWGNGKFVWDGTGIGYQVAGETGGHEAVTNVLQGVLASMNALIERERQQNPGSALGIIPNRMPNVGYDMSGYRYTDIDPLSGAEKHPALRFDTSGNPYNAEPGSPESYRSIIEGMVYSALARNAIAPEWEVLTAKQQSDAGDPKAGLTEEERAGRDGQLAAPVTGDTQTFRPVMLDLDGDGIETVSRDQSTVSFDVDDSGYLKHTGWLGSDDAFLTLDRNLNGQPDGGKELFSNAVVALGRRGLAGLKWVDANYDGRLTSVDPVWNELKVWRDLNQDGVQDEGEAQGLAALGITELNYAMGTFTQDGVKRQLASPDLEADKEGTRVSVVPEGILVQRSEDGHLSLLVTRIDDKTAVEPNRDGVSGLEDTEIIVSGTDLLANDTLGGFLGRDLTITGLTNFRHGTGFVDVNGFIHFQPEQDYAGEGAGFDYIAQAGNGQQGTGTVDVLLQNVNDAPTLDHVEHETRSIFGYTPVRYDDNGGYLGGGAPIYDPYATHDTPIAQEDTGAGRVVGRDVDDPAQSLNYELVNAPQYGDVVLNGDGTFQYTSWKEPGIESDRIVVNGQYGGTRGGTLYTSANLPGQAVYPEEDLFQVRITDPQGASRVESVSVPHYGPYLPKTPSGGGGGKKPIAVDLNSNGFEFVDVDDSNVFFDVNGDGWKRRTSWVGKDDGLLVFDSNGDGRIDRPSEISFVGYAEGAQSDLEGLAAFDSNGDGRFDNADDKWARFGVWQDANQNGVTDPGELQTLDELGVTAVNLTSNGEFQIINGQTVRGVGSMTKADGSEIAIADVAFAYSDETQVNQPDGTISSVTTSPFSPSGEEINGTAENDLILGKNGDNIVNAYAGDDVIFEDGGNDIIDAGEGNDIVYAGADNDLVMAGTGDDTVYAGLGNDALFAGEGHDAIFAAGGNDVVFGGMGNDLISGGWGNDLLSGDQGNDQVYGEAGRDALFGGAGDDELLGMSGDDYLNGGSGNDLLDGGSGIDEMIGGVGDDTYVLDDVADRVIEMAGEGNDTIRASFDYQLGAELEDLVLTGTADLSGTGNEHANRLTGNPGNNLLLGGAGDDLLDGGAGADQLIGGQGDDRYRVDDSGDTVVELAAEGFDAIRSSVSFTLPANIEELTLTGLESINATGNALDNRLIGNPGDNVLDGGGGADTMAGGRGNDTYVVDQDADVIMEKRDEGEDSVLSAIDYVLGEHLERLHLVGSNDLNGTGNELDNLLFGNPGNNRLDGGLGSDTLLGGAGDDIYLIDHSDDQVVEEAGNGVDSVFASVTYQLSDNVENLELTGIADIDGSGNALDNRLVGNSGGNRLDGGAGNDVMSGASGDDDYIVDSTSDLVTEGMDGGIDSIYSSVSYVLPEHVENLFLSSSDDLNATGNGANNHLVGNGGDNKLTGGAGNDLLAGLAGNDTLVGGAGNDQLTGGEGDDLYLINLGDGLDRIEEISGSDGIRFGEGLSLQNVALRVTQVDGVARAQVRVLDAGGCEQPDQGFDFDLSVDRWGRYVSPIERFEFSDGQIAGFEDLLIKWRYTWGDWRQRDIVTGRDDDVIVAGPRSNTIRSGSGNDVIYAGMGGDTVMGEGGNDLLFGSVGDDSLNGGCGSDILAGSYGRDTLVDSAGNDALLGGYQDDTLCAGSGNDFIAGGRHDDLIDPGVGHNVIAFNYGDGRDTLLDGGGMDTLSLGGGLKGEDLTLRRTGNDLILDVSRHDSITLKGWYGNPGEHAVTTLQLIETDRHWKHWWPVETTEIKRYDFQKLVDAFDQSTSQNPATTRWSVMHDLLEAHLEGNSGMAIGGELSESYADNGLLLMQPGLIRKTLNSSEFGSQPQAAGQQGGGWCDGRIG